jgi:bile acid:Na+ symporter, BASS family
MTVESIDQAPFSFSPAAGIALAIMVGLLVFAVSLDLKWEQFRRVLEDPRAPVIGLVGQFLLLPAVAFLIGRVMIETPSVALGLLLVTCCPGGALSNYLTSVAKGNVAVSISMTATSTITCALVTPLIFGFWASVNPMTAGLLHQIRIDPARVAAVLMIMLVIPVTLGMLLCARRPHVAKSVRPWVRRVAMVIFATVVAVVLGSNAKLLIGFAGVALLPVLLTFAVAVTLGWILARQARLGTAERRAVTLEVAMQNVALAIGTAVAFFPSFAGVAVTAALWGVVHLTCGSALAALWGARPLLGALPSPRKSGHQHSRETLR